MTDLFSDLDNGEFDNAKATKATREQRFPCPQCAGTGQYRGIRVHQGQSHCFACRGTGFFKTDPRKLAQRKARAAEKKNSAYAAFAEQHADVIKIVGEAADWSDFARSLMEQLHSRKPWSDRQLASAQSMAAKIIAKREAKAAERKAEAVEVDLSPIRAMFEAAQASGYKKPIYRAEGLKLSLAPAYGRNAGALYVVNLETDEYLGKIIGTSFQPCGQGKAFAPALDAIAADPKGAAVRYGQRTGSCACCGRELTNHASIDLGIGPICAQKWGFA